MVFAENLVLGDECMRSQTKKQLGRLGVLVCLIALFTGVLYFAIALPPALSQTIDSESDLLSKQLDFVLKMNSVFLGFLGVAGTLAAYFFGKSFKDFQTFSKENIQAISQASKERMQSIQDSSEVEIQRAVEQIKERAEREVFYLVDEELREVVRAEVMSVQRLLQRERVISSTSVDYYLPGGMQNPAETPREVELLRAREFKDVQYFTEISELRPRDSRVVVLDLIHYMTAEKGMFASASKEDRDRLAAPILKELTDLFPESSVLIVYVNGRPFLAGLDSENRYILAANSPITVVGNSADGAYVAEGAQKIS